MYLGLSHAPLFFAALLSGVVSGYLLEYLCPKEGYQQPRLLWAIIGIISMVSFLGLLVLKPCLELSPTK